MRKGIIKLFSYYGGKFYLVPDIIKEIGHCLLNYDIKCVVDVFGGSGTVILSLPREWKINRIYNDIDMRLYHTLKVLQDPIKRKQVMDFIEWSCSCRQEFDEFKDSDFDSLSDVEIAKRYLYLIRNSFNGSLDSYGFLVNTYRDPFNSLKNSIRKGAIFLKNLNIENLDFREIIKKYKGNSTLFYLDPPYLKSGKRYKFSFVLKDFKDLKNALDDSGSKWLMNESEIDFKDLKDIFGDPNYTKEYINYVLNSKIEIRSKRLEGYWKNY